MSGVERLTADEQEAIENAWIIASKDGPSGDDDAMYIAVERILAARVASAAAYAWDEARPQVGPLRAWKEVPMSEDMTVRTVATHVPYSAQDLAREGCLVLDLAGAREQIARWLWSQDDRNLSGPPWESDALDPALRLHYRMAANGLLAALASQERGE